MNCFVLVAILFGGLLLLFFVCWLIGNGLPYDDFFRDKYKK